MADKEEKQSEAVAGFMNNTYLLEMVLRHLPMQDLLRCQRVAKDWKALVGSSRALQSKLFLLPVEEEIAVVVPDREANENLICDECTKDLRVIHPPLCLHGTKILSGRIVHPLLVDQGGILPAIGSLEFIHLSEILDNMSKEPDMSQAWAEMFVTQPPCKTVTLWDREEMVTGSSIVLGAEDEGDFVRWRQVFDCIQELEDESEHHYLSKKQNPSYMSHYDWFMTLDNDCYPISEEAPLLSLSRSCTGCGTAIRHMVMQV
ncbi:hypothetical protein BDZ85DRAFT_89162 [Elsinoe ampelina]|uniref:F-box domain-containing protein n=1 Tax=Elsinoe ampelina TaxID=302913 RepID=A0A6A6GHE1_9PEZI|nr:hypothetical protein BDZ85DRAFT_89162 [Elsinoe ampelina]